MKIARQWILNTTWLCVLSACSGPSVHGGDNAIGGSLSGGSGGEASTETGGSLAFGGSTGGSESDDTGGTGTEIDAGSGSSLVLTSSQDAYWQQGKLTQVASGNADISVNDSTEAQTWQGFGGAFTELAWKYLSQLSEADRERAMQLLFGSDGARFTWGRVPIGCNDYVETRHTLDDTADDVIPDSTESNRPPADLTLSKFSIDGDLKTLVPYIKAAQAVKPGLRLWASAWTAPVWMKTGYTKVDDDGQPVKRPSYYDGGSLKNDPAILQAHAQYFVKFVQAYQAQGITIEMVAPQNEPAGGHTYPSCEWETGTYASFIGKYLGPAFTAAGLSTRVMLGGSLDSSGDTSFIKAVLADSSAKGYCAVAGLGYDMVATSKVADLKSAGMPIWVSEHKAGNYPWNTGSYKTVAPNDMAYAIETWGLIRDAINKVGVSAYNAWHMVLDRTGNNIDTTSPWAQDSLLIADAGQLAATPAYYVFRHFSRFVEPGAKVISTTGGDAVAFKNPDGSIVTVLYNSGNARTITMAVRGKKLQFAVPRSGFATLVAPNG